MQPSKKELTKQIKALEKHRDDTSATIEVLRAQLAAGVSTPTNSYSSVANALAMRKARAAKAGAIR